MNSLHAPIRDLVATRFSRRGLLRRSPVAALLLVTSVLATSARAQDLTIVGYTNGCFGRRCAVPDSGGEFQTATLGGLVFANARIREPLAGQALALAGPAVFPTGQNTNNLGSFFLGSDPFSYTGKRFMLRLTLVPPFHLLRDTSAMIGATLKATAAGEEGSPGSVTITFDKLPIRLSGTQTVTVTLSNVTLLANGDEQPIVATIERRP